MDRVQNGHIPRREHYGGDYLANGRPYSYAHQLEAVVSVSPSSVLEVGVGASIVAAGLRCCGVAVTTLDIEPTLRPDIVGSVLAMPVSDGAFDVTMCCQVLEHLPWERFGEALRELRRVTRKSLVLSVPDVTRHWGLSLSVPRLGRRALYLSVPPIPPRRFPADRLRDMGHYWEIGFRGFPLRRIAAEIRGAGWTLRRTWRVPELAWHRFFECV